jgi:hypothetical protein
MISSRATASDAGAAVAQSIGKRKHIVKASVCNQEPSL